MKYVVEKETSIIGGRTFQRGEVLDDAVDNVVQFAAYGVPMARHEEPLAATRTTWWIDPVNGSDTNPGHVVNAPLKTLTKLLSLVAPFGTWVLTADVTVNVMNDVPTGADAVSLRVRPKNGSKLLIQSAYQGVPTKMRPIGAPGTLSGVVAKNRNAGTPWSATLSGGTITTNLDQFLYDVTTNSWCVLNKDLGANAARLSEPIVTIGTDAAPNFLHALTYGSLANGDAYQLYAPIAVSFESAIVENEETAPAGAATNGAVVMWGLRATATNGFLATNYGDNGGQTCFFAKHCRFDQMVSPQGNAACFACSLPGGLVFGQNSQVLAGSIKNVALTSGTFGTDVLFTNIYSVTCIGAPQMGVVGFFDITGYLGLGGLPNLATVGCSLMCVAVFRDNNGAQLWGSVPNVRLGIGASIVVGNAASYAAVMTISSGFKFGNTTAVGCTIDRTTGTIAGNVATTWANVDTAPNSSIFDLASGARVCKAVA